MWWTWVLGVLVTWLAVAMVIGVALGRSIHAADRQRQGAGVDAEAPDRVPSAASPAPRTRRRAIPLPPVGVGLAALAVILQTAGFVLDLRGSAGAPARLLAMDAPLSVPRLFVAALFVVAAVAAALAAARIPGRRAWWSAVSLVAVGIAAVTGGTLQAGAASGAGAMAAAGAAVALAVVAGMWFLSRHERRDRRRVLGTLAGYAAASVGMSAVSGMAEQAYGVGSTAAATATYLGGAGQALAGVAFLMAVLVGVAPRLVLPAEWALRRTADAHSLEVAPAGTRVAGDPIR